MRDQIISVEGSMPLLLSARRSEREREREVSLPRDALSGINVGSKVSFRTRMQLRSLRQGAENRIGKNWEEEKFSIVSSVSTDSTTIPIFQGVNESLKREEKDVGRNLLGDERRTYLSCCFPFLDCKIKRLNCGEVQSRFGMNRHVELIGRYLDGDIIILFFKRDLDEDNNTFFLKLIYRCSRKI